jgi:hypothetical protein
MTIEIDTWFPTVIGKASCPFFADVKDKYIKYLEKKKISPSGFCYHQIHKDNKLKKLNNWITDSVNKVAKTFNFPDRYEPKQSWFIDCKQFNAQPWHAHSGFVFSVIFYLEGSSDDKGTRFKSPNYIDMKNPYNLSPDNDHKATLFNEYTYPTCTYPCIPGKLLIFRSFVEHCTDLKITDKRRIVLIYNYDRT